MGFGGWLGTSDWEVKCAEDGNRNTECINIFRRVTSWLSLGFVSNTSWISVSVVFSPTLSIRSTSSFVFLPFLLAQSLTSLPTVDSQVPTVTGDPSSVLSDMLISSSRHPYMTNFNQLSCPPKFSPLPLSHSWTPILCAPNTTCHFGLTS